MEIRRRKKNNVWERTHFSQLPEKSWKIKDVHKTIFMSSYQLIMSYEGVKRLWTCAPSCWTGIMVLRLAPGILVALCGAEAGRTLPVHKPTSSSAPNYLSVPHFLGGHLIFPTELQISLWGQHGVFYAFFYLPWLPSLYLHHRCSANICEIVNRPNEWKATESPKHANQATVRF